MFKRAVFAKDCWEGVATQHQHLGSPLIMTHTQSCTKDGCTLFLWCRIKAAPAKYNKANVSQPFITKPTSGEETQFSCSRNL